MTADVNPVALVVRGLRYSSDIKRHLINDGLDIGCFEKFVGGGQTCRARTDDNRILLFHEVCLSGDVSI